MTFEMMPSPKGEGASADRSHSPDISPSANRDGKEQEGHEPQRPAIIRAASVDDLPSIQDLIGRHTLPPGALTEAERTDWGNRGFVRPRFEPEELKQVARDGILLVRAEQGRVTGYGCALEWNHPLLKWERIPVKFRFDLKLLGKFASLTWVDGSEDWRRIVNREPAVYIAEMVFDAVDAGKPRACDMLKEIEARYPGHYRIITCSEGPIRNEAGARFMKAAGFTRVGQVNMALRPWVSGGRFEIIRDFQSGIYVKRPTNGSA